MRRGSSGSRSEMARLLILLTFPTQIRDQYRVRLAQRFPDLAIEVTDHHSKAPPLIRDADALLESRSDLRRLDVLIESLPPPLREAIALRELQELDYRQIAEVTGVPIGTVMSRLHRARAALRRTWDGKDVGNAMR